MALQEGKPIWNESLMTREQWKERTKKFATSHIPEPPQEFDCEFKWRKGMGSGFSEKEIKLYNDRIDALLKEARE